MSLINTLTLFLSFLSFTVFTFGAPLPDNVLLAKRYAPQFRFHKNEVYYPSSVDFFLSGPVTMNDNNGPVAGAPSPLGVENLGSMANQGNGMFITTDVKANINGFLRGQNPSNTQTTTYAFIAPKDNGVVDLYYWVFCPYNLGKKVPLLGYIGDHIGDWERVTVRTVNGVATQIDYHAHSDSGSGVIPYTQAPKFSPSSPNDTPKSDNPDSNARPVAYVANGSHGMWSGAGTFTYVDAVVLKLQDQTSDGGVYWDTQNSLSTINYPDTYDGSLGWLKYLGAWGNKAATNCWWYFIYKQCELVGGPNGPLRDDVEGSATLKVAITPGTSIASTLKTKMTGPLSQVLATASTGGSQYTVHLSAASQQPFVALQQQCATVNTTATRDEDVPVYSYTSTYVSLPTTSGTKQYTFSVPACDSPSTVAMYAIGDCTSELGASPSESDLEGCTFGSPRKIRAFSDDVRVSGVQEVDSVIVDDLDNWVL